MFPGHVPRIDGFRGAPIGAVYNGGTPGYPPPSAPAYAGTPAQLARDKARSASAYSAAAQQAAERSRKHLLELAERVARLEAELARREAEVTPPIASSSRRRWFRRKPERPAPATPPTVAIAVPADCLATAGELRWTSRDRDSEGTIRSISRRGYVGRDGVLYPDEAERGYGLQLADGQESRAVLNLEGHLFWLERRTGHVPDGG